MRQLHLVDGTYEVFRQFFGAPSREDSTGMEVGAVIGMLRTLLALLRRRETTHVAVAFDHVIESFRNDLFAGYKTGAGIDPVLWNQALLCEEAVATLRIPVWSMVDFETDDALATASVQYRRHFDRIVICSPDKDFAQCVVGDEVVLWDRKKDHVLNHDAVIEKFGVAPASIPDWLALVGDTADGIPGLNGWGKKSASTILSAYRHLEQIPTDPASWSVKIRGAKRLSETLESQRTDAGLYRQLATLVTDVPLETTLTDLAWRGPDEQALRNLCQRLDQPNLVAQAIEIAAQMN